MASEYDFGGPGVVKPHPKKNWVNPDAKQVHFAGDAPKPRSASRTNPGNRRGRALLQVLATVMGLIFVLIGIAGFIPGVTSGNLASNGLESDAELLGLFRVSVVGNLIHLGYGLVGLLFATRVAWSKFYLIVGGVAMLAVAAYGFIVVDQGADANVIPFNDAINVLHVGLGFGLILLGLLGVAAHTRSTA